MGSPNFKTNIHRPAFAIEYDPGDDTELISETYQQVKDEVDSINRYADENMPCHKLIVEHGYHSGFSVYVEPLISVEELKIDNFYVEEDLNGDPYICFIAPDGYGHNIADELSLMNLAKLEYQGLDGNGEPQYLVHVNDFELQSYVDNSLERAMHNLGVIAKDAGLGVIIGETWTSSVSYSQEYLEAALEKCIVPELLEPQDTPVADTLKG